MGPGRGPAGGPLSPNDPTGRLLWISLSLILVLAQILTSQIVFAAEFIRGAAVLVSPFRTCRTCGEFWCCSSTTEIQVLVVLGLYVPLVLVAFALLATLFAAYAKDRALPRFSLICQAASSLLLLTGTVAFLVVNRPHVAWESLTPWFYACVGAQVELVVTGVLTYFTWRRVKSGGCDWK